MRSSTISRPDPIAVRPGGVPGQSRLLTALIVFVLGSLAYDFFAHVASPRAELLADVGLVAILAGGAVYLLLHDQPLGAGGGWGLVPPAIIATTAVMLAAGAAVLTLWNL